MTFFEDFKKLKQKTVHLGARGFKNTNCDYNDFLYFSKNCFMCFDADKFWDCFYCVEGNDLKNCCDCSTCDKCELCFSCLDCLGCFDGIWLQDCRRVSESLFCYDCVGCNHCFGCVGLRQKNYHLFNKQLSEEDWEKGVQEWKMKGLHVIWEEFERLKETVPRRAEMFYRSEDSSGNHLTGCKNAYDCYNSANLQDCGHLYRIYNVYGDRNRDTWNAHGGVDLEDCHEFVFMGKGYNSSFCYYCEVVRDCDYCFQVFNSKNCFGCIGVNHGEYMILNKKYEPEEWARKKAEVIEEMKKDGEWGQWPLAEGERFDAG